MNDESDETVRNEMKRHKTKRNCVVLWSCCPYWTCAQARAHLEGFRRLRCAGGGTLSLLIKNGDLKRLCEKATVNRIQYRCCTLFVTVAWTLKSGFDTGASWWTVWTSMSTLVATRMHLDVDNGVYNSFMHQ